MIKDNQKRLNRFHVVLDAFVILASYWLAWFVIMVLSPKATVHNRQAMAEVYILAAVMIVPLYLILYAFFHLYTPKRVQGRRTELGNIIKANTIGILAIALVLFLNAKNDYVINFSRWMVVCFYVFNIVLEFLERNLIRRTLRSMRSKGYNQKHILLVGYSRAAESFIDRVSMNPEWGYQVRGILDDHEEWGKEYKGVRVIGKTGELEAILELNTLDEIAITLGLREYGKLEKIVAACEKSGVHTKFIPDYNNMIPTLPYMEDLQGLPVIHIRHVPLTSLTNATMKRIIDIFGALVAIVLFSPIMLGTAAAVKLTSRGPVIFSQERVGLHNKPFKMYKFRSMEVQAPSQEKSKWTTPGRSESDSGGKIYQKDKH